MATEGQHKVKTVIYDGVAAPSTVALSKTKPLKCIFHTAISERGPTLFQRIWMIYICLNLNKEFIFRVMQMTHPFLCHRTFHNKMFLLFNL